MNRADYDIICFSLARWDAPISSPALSIAKELALSNRVFFIDHPFSYRDFFADSRSARIRKLTALVPESARYQKPFRKLENLTVVTTPLTVPINFLPAGPLYNRLWQMNSQKLTSLLTRLIRDFKIENYLFINFFDPYYFHDFPDHVKPYKSIYHCMDDIREVPYTARHGAQLEDELIKKYDVTLCTSSKLFELKRPFAKRCSLLPNAADFNLFTRASTNEFERPEELKGINEPIIGFIGSLEYRSDFELIEKIAMHHQRKQLIFVGPVSASVGEMKRISLPNVRFIKPKALEDLPAYLQFFNCAIIPYKKNALTSSIYPLKVNEYLAAGKPVVTTSFSYDIISFSEVVYVADNHHDFISAIDKAIVEDNDALRNQRIQVASRNSWKARVNTLWSVITE